MGKMKVLVDREDIVELQELLHITPLGGPPTFPHPANLSRARRILQAIIDNNLVDEQGFAI